jgi:hypothetical protein
MNVYAIQSYSMSMQFTLLLFYSNRDPFNNAKNIFSNKIPLFIRRKGLIGLESKKNDIGKYAYAGSVNGWPS